MNSSTFWVLNRSWGAHASTSTAMPPTTATASTPPASPSATPSPLTLRQQLPATFANLIAAALTTVAALSWTDAFKSLFQRGGFWAQHASLGPWVIAVMATLVAVIGTRLVYNLYPGITVIPTPPPALTPAAQR